jgi:hypothetical protein
MVSLGSLRQRLYAGFGLLALGLLILDGRLWTRLTRTAPNPG